MAGLQKLFGIGYVQGAQGLSNSYQTNKGTNNFVKNTFNFGTANPNRPNQVIAENNLLGIPSRGTRLYCLG